MQDAFQHPRIRTLLRDAEDAERLLSQVQEPQAREVREALDTIHRDLGRALVALWRANSAPVPAEPPELTDVPEITDPPVSTHDGGWYTDEVDLGPAGTLFKPGELVGDDTVPLPSATAPTWNDEEDTNSPRIQSMPIGLQSARVPTESDAAWVNALRELVDLLGADVDLEDPGVVATEASRIQWATSGMTERWSDFPDAVKQALLGMLAARARALEGRVESDLGPRLALDRLRRYRHEAGLQPAVGLLAERGPETSSWSEDAKRWWSMLHQGLSASDSGGSLS